VKVIFDPYTAPGRGVYWKGDKEESMKLSSLHILLTYQCTCECEHCFVWGGPRQQGTLTLAQIEVILEQAGEAGIQSIYFEGGEPFLYYGVLTRAVQSAAQKGFHVGIVTNGYWANSVEDAQAWLQPFKGLVEDLSISSDLFHCAEELSDQAQNAVVAAKWLGIPAAVIRVAQPEVTNAPQTKGRLTDESAVMYRGRAASRLAGRATKHAWGEFDACPHEDLREPGRIHLDPLGNLHICQGIAIGNVFRTPLKEICESYDPDAHSICGPLLEGGPAALVTEYNLPHAARYADACHLCYDARLALRTRFPEELSPDQMYGVFE
jgi:MoaA/NifB/PqqE/SkfB family radical SAM enzyme